MTWIEKVQAWIDSPQTRENSPHAFSLASGIPKSNIEKPLREKSGYLSVENTLRLAKFMRIRIDQMLDEEVSWPVPEDRVKRNLDWSDPEAVKAIDDLVARSLHRAADGLEK